MAQHPNKSHTFVKGVRVSELVIGFVIKRLGSATPKEWCHSQLVQQHF